MNRKSKKNAKTPDGKLIPRELNKSMMVRGAKNGPRTKGI